MPPGPVKSFTHKRFGPRVQYVRTSHRQFKDHLGTNGDPNSHPLEIGGLGFHIPKIAMSPMLICLNEERKREIPYKECKMKDIGAHVGYKVLWGRVSKVVGAGMQMCYYMGAPPIHVMAVLSGTRGANPMFMGGYPLLCGGLRVRRGCGRHVLGCVLLPLVVLLLNSSCS